MLSKLLFICLVVLFIFNQKSYSQSLDAEVLRYSSSCDVTSGKLIQTDSLTIQINNRVGDKYTEISIPYSKNDKISDLEAWIENMDGSRVRTLKKSDIVDKSAISDISLYEDSFNKCFQLKHNMYPYKVVYTYKTTYRNFISIAWWSPIVYRELPTQSAKLKIILPKSLPYQKYVKNVEGNCQIDSSGNDIRLLWKTTYDKPIKTEIFSQPENYYPLVIVSPLNFQYGVDGSTKDWQSFGNWQYRLNQDLDLLPDEEKLTISKLIEGMTDKIEIIKTLYHYLQDHTRYINVSIGIGGLKPYPASYVAQNKYGDCKALTNYMKAMLKYAGIESFYTTVYASEQPRDIIKNYAGPQFNHVILAVPLEKDTIWLENTLNTNPFGYLGTYTQNREALLVCKEHSQLVHIPAMKMDNDNVSYKFIFDFNLKGGATVAMNILFKGDEFERFNQLHSDFNDDEKDRIIRDYMPFDNYEVINWELKKAHRDSTYIKLNASLTLNNFLKPIGPEFYFSLYHSRIPAFSLPVNRTYPVVLPYPISNSDTLFYNLPIGYEMKTKIDSVSLKTQFGMYEISSQISKGKIKIIKRFELYQGSYKTDQYAGFYSFIQSIKDIENKKIVIKPIN